MSQDVTAENIKTDAGRAEINVFELFYRTVRILRSFSWIVLVLGLLGAALSAVISVKTYKPVYVSQAVFAVRIDDKAGVSYNSTVAKQMAKSFPHILSSSTLQKRILADLGKDKMPGELSSDALGETNMFSITATASDSKTAYDIVTSAVKNYPEIAEYTVGKTVMTMVIEPEEPSSPSNSPSTLKNAIIGLGVGLVIGCALMVAAAMLENTVLTTEDIEKDIGCRCLGAIPIVRTDKKTKLSENEEYTLFDGVLQNGFSDAVRFSASTAFQHVRKAKARVVTVTSTTYGEEKSGFAANLAITAAKKGYKTALVDCDQRKPSVMRVLKIKKSRLKNGADLSLAVAGNCHPEDAALQIENTRLYVFPILEPVKNTADFIESPNLGAVISYLKENYDYVIIDAPPVELYSDARQLAGFSDGLIYVIGQDRIKKNAIVNNIRSFSYTGVEMIGAVLTKVTGSIVGGYGYGYGKYGYGKYGYGKYGYGKYGYGKYGYGYGYGEEPKKKSSRQNEHTSDDADNGAAANEGQSDSVS